MPLLFLNKYFLGGLALLALIITIGFMQMRIENLALERDAAEKAALAYKQTLSAYQDQYAAQVRVLNSEKGREIIRQENLLKTLNLIGDMNETDNVPVSGAALRIIDSMYATTQ